MSAKKALLATGLWMLLFTLTSKRGQMIIAETEEMIISGLTRGERNNNPGNIRPNPAYKWQGQIGVDSGNYIIFDDAVNGIRAIGKDLITKFSRRLDTVQKIIEVYAPPSENLTGSYVNAVAKSLGVSPNTRINLYDQGTLLKFVRAIIKHENGRISFPDSVIETGVIRALGG